MYCMLSYPLSHLHFHTVDVEDCSMGNLTQLIRIDTVFQLTQHLLMNTKASFFHGQSHLPFISDGLTPADDKGRFCF